MSKIQKITSVFIAVFLLCGSFSVSAGQTLLEQISDDNEYGESFSYEVKEDFSVVRESYAEKGYTHADIDKPIRINASEIKSSGTTPKVLKEHKNRSNVIHWQDNNNYIEWEVNIPADGIYAIRLEYIAGDEKIDPIKRSLLIDGKCFYSEVEELSFYRLFRDIGKPQINSIGDEVASDVEQYFEWQWQDLIDTDASYDGVLQFYLTSGNHTIRMEMISGSIYLSQIELYSAKELPSYEEVSKTYTQNGYKPGNDKIYFEAESNEYTLYKNSSSLRPISNGDPATSPYEYGKALINCIGDTLWQGANNSICYQFNVKSAGLYAISMRLKMNYRDGIPSYRSIAIDGEIPFREFSNYAFDYDKNWRTDVLSNEKGEVYYIYLSEGTHTLTMTVKQGDLQPITALIEKNSLQMSEMLLLIRMIVGQNPDYNFDYELDKQIPELIPTLKSLVIDMEKTMRMVQEVSGRKNSKFYQLKSFIEQLNELIKDPFVIPSRINSLEEIMTSYSEWIKEMQQHPLMLDFIEIVPDKSDGTVSKSNFFERTYASILNFLLSFTKDYDNISVGLSEDVKVHTTISVWTSRGVKWCNAMKQLIDTDFTPTTGISVKLNVLPTGQLNSGGANALLLAVSSGNAPDAATGIASGSVEEFAMRNALADVSKFDNYKEISSRFKQQHFVPMTYNGKVYGIPETQNFLCMVYRKDIFTQLGLCIPNTWEEVYNKIIPVLNQNNMQFYVPFGKGGYDIFLFQNNGKYYKDDMKTTALDSSEAYQAFLDYTNLFSLYGIPKTANFYNRFRTGEMPIGIADYNTYMTLVAAAGDINGKWGMALIPGNENETGEINRSHSTLSAESCVIMQQSKNQDASWQFINWWTSDDVQQQYADRLESLLGISARWATANHNTFMNLSWNMEEKSIIEASFDDAVTIPVVMGGYYVGRHVTNALNRVVISNDKPRNSLEITVEDINRELKRRRESIS